MSLSVGQILSRDESHHRLLINQFHTNLNAENTDTYFDLMSVPDVKIYIVHKPMELTILDRYVSDTVHQRHTRFIPD